MILPENAEELRNAVKRFGDIEMGVPTQCVRWSDRRVKEIMNNKINQYHNNLILKYVSLPHFHTDKITLYQN